MDPVPAQHRNPPSAGEDEPDAILRLSSRTAFQTPRIRVQEDEIRYRDGTTSTYWLVDKPDFALIVPYADGGFWLVEQFRYPLGGRFWEFPQGAWPPGHTGGTMDELARVELAEETGLTAARWRHLGTLWAACGYSAQAFGVYCAEEFTEGAPSRERAEQDMRHRWFAEPDVRAMITNGELADSHTIAGLALFDQYRASGAEGQPPTG